MPVARREPQAPDETDEAFDKRDAAYIAVVRENEAKLIAARKWAAERTQK